MQTLLTLFSPHVSMRHITLSYGPSHISFISFANTVHMPSGLLLLLLISSLSCSVDFSRQDLDRIYTTREFCQPSSSHIDSHKEINGMDETYLPTTLGSYTRLQL